MCGMMALAQAVEALHAKKVIAYPTEAVYGLGCDPLSEAAVSAIWQLKQRPAAMGLILIAGEWQQLMPYMATLTAEQISRLRATWPGAMTWVVPAAPQVPIWLTGGRTSIALRWSAHADVRALCAAWGGALVSTSANLHGQSPCRSKNCVFDAFQDNPLFAGVVAGKLGNQERPTPIKDLITDQWIRQT
jgi:L-threonylcarbamoyladenylate synthase